MTTTKFYDYLNRLSSISSAPGSDPWGGDHPMLYGQPTITEDQDKAGSEQVDSWLRDKARHNGISGI